MPWLVVVWHVAQGIHCRVRRQLADQRMQLGGGNREAMGICSVQMCHVCTHTLRVWKGAPCSFMVMLSFGTATILIDDEQASLQKQASPKVGRACDHICKVGTLGVKQYIGDVNLLGMAVDSAVHPSQHLTKSTGCFG
eukprot:4566003-Amphidinium_carterae.1